ncbi:MAG: hypothetical protein ACI9H1_000470 [Polaribacter sp.]|jgi:hypothetical protein|tara:strand:+ start:351 stop:545 length:195 start_codon:yes stop_codon:yes gene_type:complete
MSINAKLLELDKTIFEQKTFEEFEVLLSMVLKSKNNIPEIEEKKYILYTCGFIFPTLERWRNLK